MTDWQLKTPVALLIFRRPDTTEKVFEAIRQAKPPKLLVVSNMGRPTHPEEVAKCKAARSIIERVDWDCEVLTNYADTYLGCKQRIYSGLDWVFQNVEEAIIFEDDCVPHSSFFRFCEEMLERYRHDERIMAVTGDNFQTGRHRNDASYYFSRYTHFWGWATWRRAWQHYDVNMKVWPEIRDHGWLLDWLGDPKMVNWWVARFEEVYSDRKDTWDYQWIFSCWVQSGLCIVPKVNMVSNLGFGSESTHTRDSYDWRAGLPARELAFPLTHPRFVLQDEQADVFTQEKYYYFITNQRNLTQRAKRKIYRAKKLLQEFQSGDRNGSVWSLVNQILKEENH